MKRLLRAILTAGSSRAMPPLIIGFFFFVYIGIAFFTDETLITLMAFTRKSSILAGILALIPLNSLLRFLRETGRHHTLRTELAGKTADIVPELFDEAVTLPVSPPHAAVLPASEASASFTQLQSRLVAEGYKTRCSENALTAWRGASLFPARILFLAATFCLFTGILISITTRSSNRQVVIEGEQLPTTEGTGGTVERITLANSSGSILSRTLTLEVAPSKPGDGNRIFGLYPPSLYNGSFVYPRYLGIALFMRFSAPDMPTGYENQSILNCYPPGKEDSKSIPGSPYRIVISIPDPGVGTDRYISYVTGRMILQFKLLKGKDVLFTGSAPSGGEFVRDGFRLAFPEVRRLVITDFIRDYGVFFVWAAGLLFIAAGSIWLPVRVFFPRREMLFLSGDGLIRACSRSEGRGRQHRGVFHEALDQLETRRSDRASFNT